MRAISNLWGRLLGSAIGLAVAGTAFGAPLQDWFFKAGAEIFSVPAVDQKSLYFGACDGNFYCLDKKSGKQRWRRGGFDRIDSSPVIYGAAVVFCAVGDRLCALKRASGDRLWEVSIEGCGNNNPLLRGDTVLVPGHNQIAALNVATGKSVTTYKLNGNASPLSCSSKLICVVVNSDLERDDYTGAGELSAFRYEEGKPIWSTKLGGACLGSLACDETKCYLGARDGRFYAISLTDGRVLWQIDCRNLVSPSRGMLLDGELPPELRPRVWADGHVELLRDRVLFSIGHQNIDEPSAIVAVDKDSGKRAWVAHHSARICGRFTVASGWAVAATQDRKVLGILLLDGATAFSADLPKADRGEFAGIALDSGSLFLAGADGTVSRMSLNSISNSSR